MVLLLQQKYDPVHEKSLRILFGQSFPLQQSPELPGEEAASKVMLAIDFLRVIHVPARMTLLLT